MDNRPILKQIARELMKIRKALEKIAGNDNSTDQAREPED